MDSSLLKVNFSLDGKKKFKLKKDAMEYVDLLSEYMKDPKFKTELCRTYAEKDFCVYGNKCRFAHGKEELFQKAISHPKYKVKRCISFFQNAFCTYGSRCHFQHEERKINQTFRSYYSYVLNLHALNCDKFEMNFEKNEENLTFFDEKEPTPVIVNNRPISPIIKASSVDTSLQEELIYEKMRSKVKVRRLPIFQQITEGKKVTSFNPFHDQKPIFSNNFFYPMF